VEVEQACTRALGLAQELGRDDLSYAPQWGLWTNHFLRGNLVSALETAESVFQMGRSSGMRALEMLGRHALAYTLVYMGEFDRTLEEAEAGLALYEPEQEKEIANSFGMSSVVCLLACRAHSLWMLGHVEEADENYDRMLQIARELGHPFSLACALTFTLHGAFRYSYTGEMGRLAGIAEELMALVKEVDFFFWYVVTYTYQGLIAEALGEEERARTQMLEGLELFAQTGSERARAQRALSLELRAALDLYELRADDGRSEEGRALLASVLARFTQGFDRPELASASAIVRASL
jgi:tetratricopeptide (TPR) repeat protein